MTQTQNSLWRTRIEEFISANAQPPDKFAHQPRLYTLALEVGRGQGFDDDVLHAAAWLHDLGVFVGHRPENPELLARWDHIRYALEHVPDVLQSFGFPGHKIPAVLDAIRDHMPASQPATVEGVILRDADILEQLGAVAVLRTVSKVGRDTRFHTHQDAVQNLRRALVVLPDQIKLETTRTLAQPRIQALRAFLEAVQNEVNNGAL
jgi:uncharacterized protein